MTSSKGAAVIVVGGGVTGLSAGWWLARSGADVLVIDKGIVGWEASGRNGGSAAQAYSPFFVEQQRLWPQMDELLGYPTEYRHHRLRVALTEAQLAHYVSIVQLAESQGFSYETLDPAQLRDLVPLASEAAIGGLFLNFGGHANPQRTVQAYAWALQDHGGRIMQHTTVTGIALQGGRATSVMTRDGPLGCDTLVLAAGPHTAQLVAMVGRELPLAQARAEMMVTEPVPMMRYGGVDGNGIYGRQTLRGNLAYGGGPYDWVELDGPETPSKPSSFLMRNLAKRLVEIFPKAGHARVIRSWSGIVEVTPDGRPVIDRLDDPSNVVVATMSSLGFGLSPVTGRAVMDLVLDGRCGFADLSTFGLDRFDTVPADWREERGWLPLPARSPVS